VRTLSFRTAGESHGKGLLALLEGLPFGCPVDAAAIDAALARRQGGYGRSNRQAIESDRVEILAGTKRGKTLGGPVALWVGNKDHRIDDYRTLTRPRPGHADLAGAIKYGTKDVADVMERASARETAARVAAGALAASLLGAAGISVKATVRRIGTAELSGGDLDDDPRAKAVIDDARARGDTVGGAFEVVATGVPAGFGSYAQWDTRLDGRLAQAVMSIPGIKAVEIGAGVAAATTPGSELHDPIGPGDAGGFSRPTNRAGGVEGGMTNGQPVVVRATMKPIPTLGKPLPSVDLVTGRPAEAVYERSDVCSVPAASVVGEAMVALVILDAALEAAAAPTFDEFLGNLAAWKRRAALVRPPAP
jgi:chorismate synthase